MRVFIALGLLSAGVGCIVVVDDDVGDEFTTCVPCEERGEVFGPDEGCPNECINRADESCWHVPGSCDRGDDDADAEVSNDG